MQSILFMRFLLYDLDWERLGRGRGCIGGERKGKEDEVIVGFK
jgi:hypothetical protein